MSVNFGSDGGRASLHASVKDKIVPLNFVATKSHSIAIAMRAHICGILKRITQVSQVISCCINIGNKPLSMKVVQTKHPLSHL